MKKIKKIYYSGDVHFTKDISDKVEQYNLKVEFEYYCEAICGYFDEYIDAWNEEFDGSEDEYVAYIDKVFTNFVNNYNQHYSTEMNIVICVENGNHIYAYPKNDRENLIFYSGGWFYHKEENETENVIEHENEETGENKKLLRSVIISTVGAVLLPTPGQIVSSILCLKDYMKSKGD
jgi:hypothetical protein